MEKLSANFEAVLEQLNQATQGKDRNQSELLAITSEREALRREIEKVKELGQAEIHAKLKHIAKVERERNKAENELTEARAKASRLDDRVNNLNKIVAKLEA